MTTPSPTPSAASVDSVVIDFGLRAQVRMSPYMMGFFGIGLPVFVWSAQLGLSTWLLALYMVLFIANWTAFMVLKSQAETRQEMVVDDIRRRESLVRSRLWRQGAGGAIWAVSLLIISLSASTAGPGAVMFLMVCAGAAVGIIFFTSPVLIHALILGPVAVAGPIFGMQLIDHGTDWGTDLRRMMTGGLALALAMGFVLNRHMREHYLLQHKQLEIAAEREAARAETDAAHDAKLALMETLQREVQTSLKGLEQNLVQCLTHLARAPAPRQYVDAALSEVGHLQSILVTTLDNDVAAAGHIELHVEPLDIDLICEKLVAQYAGQAHGKELTFSYTLQGVAEHDGQIVGAALGDARRVEQILGHLLNNAILYTQSGRVELKVMPAGEDMLRLEVVDSGPGLSGEELAQAFAPHARIQRTSSGHSGAGLGLSLSRTLAELMGGRVDGESTLDVGSKFWLDLPFDKTAMAAPRAVEADGEAAAEVSEHSLRVLLLSNDSLRSAQLRDSLEHMGHRCLTSTSRERALALARKAPVDACLISTGPFENLEDADNRGRLEGFLDQLRATQTEAGLNILALVPAGDQVEELKAMGVRPLLLPQNRESLGRALAAV